MDDDRRWKYVIVDRQCLCDALNGGGLFRLNMPTGCVVRDVDVDHSRRALRVLLSNPMWPRVEPGCEIEVLAFLPAY